MAKLGAGDVRSPPGLLTPRMCGGIAWVKTKYWQIDPYRKTNLNACHLLFTPAQKRQSLLKKSTRNRFRSRFYLPRLPPVVLLGTAEFLAWLLARDIQPHIPVIDRRHQTQGHFTREHFRYEPKENAYYCPEGKALRYRGQSRGSRGNVYRSTEAQCLGCLQKKLCTSGPNRKLFVHWEEPARQTVRGLAGTPEYKRSQRARYKVEALFAEL